MDLKKLSEEIKNVRIYGTTYLAVYKKSARSEWEQSFFEHFPNFKYVLKAEASVESFIKSLIKISDKKLACDIITILIHQDLAYDAEMIPLEEAALLANKFFSLFSNQAAYFFNSTWNEHEHSQVDKDFKLGLSSWTSLTEATFDSGIIICDNDKIGIAWFADED